MPDLLAADRAAQALADRFADLPFTHLDALTVVSDRSLRTAVTRGRVLRVGRGVFAIRAEDDRDRYRQRIAAALILRPRAVASDEAGLAILGCSQPRFGSTWGAEPVRLTAAQGGRVRRSSLVVVQRTLPPHHVRMTRWGAVTSPARTAVDLARTLDFASALIAADECTALVLGGFPDGAGSGDLARLRGPQLRRRVAGCQEQAGNLLRNASSEAPCRVGARRVAAVAAWVDPAAESPGESFSRARLIMAGVPRPIVGLPVMGDDGRSYVADLAWLPQRVIGEVDGYGKYSDGREALIREKHREDALRARGWGFVRWTVAEMLTRPEVVVARVQRALRRGVA